MRRDGSVIRLSPRPPSPSLRWLNRSEGRPIAPRSIVPRQRDWSILSRTTSAPATSRPPPGSQGSSSTSTGTPRGKSTRIAHWPWRGRPVRGKLFLLLAATLGGLRRQRGKLAEAAELLDGGIEAARLLGNTHALVWTLMGRSAAALRSGDVQLALATAQESVELSQEADSNFHAAEAA